MTLFGRKKNSTQQLIGAKIFTRNGILTGRGELIFFSIRPTNLAVLSYDNVQAKVHNLQMLLQTEQEIEFVCLDSCERFDGNKEYLRARYETETNEKIRRLIKHDLELFEEIQGEVSVSRQFLICIRNMERHEFTSEQVSSMTQKLCGYNLEAKHLGKSELKQMLGIYLGAGTSCDLTPDYDGQQYMEGSDDEE